MTTPSTSAGVAESDDEWEEMTMVVQVSGVLDAQSVRDHVQQGSATLRRPATDAPILQVGNSIYTCKWTRPLGTDIVLESDGQQLSVLSVSDRRLLAEKALLTASNPDEHNKNAEQIGDDDK